jgi:putative pyruvate formate lyase activating enzyme
MPLSAQESLPNYFVILKGERLPGYIRLKSLAVEASLNDRTEVLWQEHRRIQDLLEDGTMDDSPTYPSFLDLKTELAKRFLFNCELCERRCEVDRTEKKGTCKVTTSKVASKFVHWGEEPELVPSYTIFFSRCTFKCIFCQNWDISQFDAGEFIDPERLASDIERKFGSARNVNWVGGEPTPNLPYILEVLGLCGARMPQVWNSNMFMSSETVKILDGLVDLYLTDFKYGNDSCASRLSKVDNYFSVVSRNHRLANEQCEMIIRHLVMPNHFDCCSKPILSWVAENLELERVRVNVMDQYRPQYNAAEADELRKPLEINEFYKAYNHAESLGLNLVD